ncbi:hypothetical protein [Hymenobacter sp. YC55]|uniref:hypothetical protein n=1 Tax=Hymenobacter sp. YC55 TaxID=3034019 RepID=UPI0023F77AC3|nr:hypothetical protein [Hymenobacter sp. YC55]MDF7811148.1 hypothetical protein [Hymenobacter sp. YC55]
MHSPEFIRQAGDAQATATSHQTTAWWLTALRQPWPVAVRIVVVVALYGCYFLLGGGLQGERMPYDAGHYWELAVGFKGKNGSFSLLNFQDPTRGYLAALVQFPALIVRYLTNCTMPTAAKVTGTGWAAFLFAFLIPELWQSLARRRISGGRWLLLVLLTFGFWRDHFSFTASDIPALALLLLALWAVSCAPVGWWLVAGLSLAGATNCRPMYLAAVPPALLLAAWWSRQHGRSWQRWLALLVGAAVALGPQLAINRLHFNSNSPLVEAQVSNVQHAPLYLKQLTWGTRVLRYDTDLRQRLVYADSAGLAVLRREGLMEYTSYGQFFGTVGRHPVDYGWRYIRHLFNGLDVLQPSLYLLRDYGPERPWLQLLNYSAIGLGLSVLLSGPLNRWLRWPQAWAVLTLLLPCLIAVPMAMEGRFLLPLHLLLLTTAAFEFKPQHPKRWLQGQPIRALVMLVLVAAWLGGCFWLSSTTTRNLVPDRGKSLVDD